ncbi:MAG: alpha/beta hydrolase [Lachnospiraceae bacterium]|nr:alpha/beta hydrolase [Lachnospiraceae bacterium]MDY4968867.1 alpha/beta hydrolase [Lachnospiraceae bacterium]
MKKHFTYLSSDGITNIHAIEWIPDREVKAILQISHGMVEYIDRYDDFARYLNQYGIYVTGNDHLGHGLSVQRDSLHGYFHKDKGNEYVIGDIHKLRKTAEKKYPHVPYFMLGHSMGSFLIRQYMELYGKGLSGVIIMGTGSQPVPVLIGGKILCRCIAAVKGWEYRSALIDNMAFASYNKRFEPARTDKDWLTKDETIVDAYLASPWCTFRFTVNAYYHMFRGIQFLQKKKNIQKIPQDLPLFLVSGADDPVGNFGKSVRRVYKNYKACGIQNVHMKLYADDRHEILNETDRHTVYKDILNWIEKTGQLI